MRRVLSYLAMAAFGIGVSSAANAADRIEPAPAELEKVRVDEKMEAQIPLSLRFMDSEGRQQRLADLVGDKPVILTFNYSNCPMLCSVQLHGLVDSMSQLVLELGEDYEVVTVSLDPGESRERATEIKESYLDKFGRKGGESWSFLRGTHDDIRALADSVGFGYHYFRPRKEYLHPAVLVLLSPEGTVSTYLYGTRYEPEALHRALVKAAAGEVSEVESRFIHSCYQYEAPKGNGAVVAKVMRYGGLVFVLGFAFALAVFGFRRTSKGSEFHQVGSSEDHV